MLKRWQGDAPRGPGISREGLKVSSPLPSTAAWYWHRISREGLKVVEGDGGALGIEEFASTKDLCQYLFSRRFLALYYPQGYRREYGLIL
jgi:hypothetical protein